MKILVFGDSNSADYLKAASLDAMHDITVSRFPGLSICGAPEQYLFLLEAELRDDHYNAIVVSMGTNERGKGYTPDEIAREIGWLEQMVGSNVAPLLFVGPHMRDVDTAAMDTTDGIHFDDSARAEIGCALDRLFYVAR